MGARSSLGALTVREDVPDLLRQLHEPDTRFGARLGNEDGDSGSVGLGEGWVEGDADESGDATCPDRAL